MSQVRVEEQTLVVELPGEVLRLARTTLPARYIDWLERGRRRMYARLLDGDSSIRFFSGHLPVVVTHGPDAVFPCNCANKGVGFLPRPRYLEEFIELFERTIRRTRGRPWRTSLAERVKAISRVYLAREKIELGALTTLEIFAKTTYANLRRRPLASLLYTGTCPEYTSFQLNCAVEILGPDDPRHTFIRLARNMFEHDDFHLTQSRFPHAYVFWISAVIDKTPYRVAAGPDDARVATEPADGLRWHTAARDAVGRAPGLIRALICQQVEAYARQQGVAEITPELVQAARAART